MEYECRQYLFKLLQQPEPQPMTHTVVLLDEARRQRALDAVREAPVGYVVKISEPTRNLEQNAAQWPYLEAFADKVEAEVRARWVQRKADQSLPTDARLRHALPCAEER